MTVGDADIGMFSKQKENLINCQMYFHDVLGYKSYFREQPKSSTLFPPNIENEVLVLEVGSAYDMIKYMDNDERMAIGNWAEKIDDILAKKIAIPDFFLKWYSVNDTDNKIAPSKVVATILGNEHEEYTSTGKLIAYFCVTYAFSGNGTQPYLDYFLYCFDRECAEFKAISNNILNNIETYLKAKNRPIYHSF